VPRATCAAQLQSRYATSAQRPLGHSTRVRRAKTVWRASRADPPRVLSLARPPRARSATREEQGQWRVSCAAPLPVVSRRVGSVASGALFMHRVRAVVHHLVLSRASRLIAPPQPRLHSRRGCSTREEQEWLCVVCCLSHAQPYRWFGRLVTPCRFDFRWRCSVLFTCMKQGKWHMPRSCTALPSSLAAQRLLGCRRRALRA